MALKFCYINALSKLSFSKNLLQSSRLLTKYPYVTCVTSKSRVSCKGLCNSCQSAGHCQSHRHLLQQYVQYSSASVLNSVWQRMGFTGRLKYKKYILKRSALRLYLCCMELPDYNSMMQELHLNDTFNSWFRLVELHIWMAMVRLSAEEGEGKFLRDHMMVSLWEDVNKKSKKLGELAAYSSRLEGLQQLADQFKASLFAYDEGLMSDDVVLAGALWRNLFDKNCAHASHLELMVEYVRKQLSHLDRLESNPLLFGGLMTFLPLHETPENIERQKQILVEITNRV